jgi:hypothetical protein
MKIEVDFSQPSTLRGLVWFVGCVIALIFLTYTTPEKAMAVMAIAGAAAGGLGVAVKD